MQTYINQLLEDIAKAHRSEQEEPQKYKPQSVEEHFEEIERWLESDPEHTFSYYCGLEPEQFPPAERLTDEQLDAVYRAYGQLLFSWNLGADILDAVPLRKAYPLLISTLKKKVEIMEEGQITIEFCTCDPPSCPFEEHCTCKDIKEPNEMDFKALRGADELPF